MQRALGEGDEVITTSGIYGFITGFDGDIIWLEIDDNIQIRVARASVQRKVDTSGMTPEIAESRSSKSTPLDDLTDDNDH
jgi:preprotein translocase subunit YajC